MAAAARGEEETTYLPTRSRRSRRK